MMPWPMAADVTDEDELACGERREGVFMGIFTFVRKISGAAGVFLGLSVLDLVGFRPNVENGEAVLLTIRGLTAGVPILFILGSLAIATKYTLGQAEHESILTTLETQRRTLRRLTRRALDDPGRSARRAPVGQGYWIESAVPPSIRRSPR